MNPACDRVRASARICLRKIASRRGGVECRQNRRLWLGVFVFQNAPLVTAGRYGDRGGYEHESQRHSRPVLGHPNRRSRTIRVALGRVYVDDFNATTEERQDDAGERLDQAITVELTRLSSR